MATLTITLPDKIKKAAAEDGVTVKQWVERALGMAMMRRSQKQLDTLLLERMKGPFVPVTKQDFDDIRAELYARHPELKEKKHAGRAVARGKRRRAD
jgi:hypothetical protein